jgi:hypothetical protein
MLAPSLIKGIVCHTAYVLGCWNMADCDLQTCLEKLRRCWYKTIKKVILQNFSLPADDFLWTSPTIPVFGRSVLEYLDIWMRKFHCSPCLYNCMHCWRHETTNGICKKPQHAWNFRPTRTLAVVNWQRNHFDGDAVWTGGNIAEHAESSQELVFVLRATTCEPWHFPRDDIQGATADGPKLYRDP